MPELDDDAIREAIISKELSLLGDELPDLNRYRSYYEGEQSLVYSTAKFREMFGTQFDGFRDNFTQVVANAVTDKMLLKGIRVGRENEQDDSTRKLASLIWEQFLTNDMDEQQADLFGGMSIEGRSALIVWPDGAGGVTLDWQPAQLVRVRYDDDVRGKVAWATKRWITADDATYVTFYTPDSVYKYTEVEPKEPGQQSRRLDTLTDRAPGTSTFRVYQRREVVGEPWPLPNPFGRVPVIEFPNAGWTSELKGVIPQQDALNYILMAQMVAAEFSAVKQRVVVTGQSPPTGGFKTGPGIVWELRPTFNPDGSVTIPTFGTFDASDPSTYIKIVEMYLQHMAFTTQTPVSYFFNTDRGGRGDAASGESLKVDAKPLVDKVLKRERISGNRMYQAVRLISDTLSDTPDDLPIGEVIWQDPRAEYRMALLDEATKYRDLGYPMSYIHRHLGLSAEEIEMVEEEREAEKEQAQKDAQAQAEMQARQAMMPPPSPSPKSSSPTGPGKLARA